MRLLVLGAGGFIGKRFVEMFAGKHDIVPSDHRDLTVYNALADILAESKPDVILNLAGKSYHTAVNDAEIYESNALIQLNIHEAVNHLQLKARIILCSSSGVYKGVLSREPVGESAPCLPVVSYTKAKYIQERIALSYQAVQHVVIARLFNVVGAFQHKEYFVPTLIEQALRYKKHEIREIKLFTRDATRDFIFIDDVCTAIDILMEKGINGEIYNVCSGEETSILELIGSLMDILGVSDPCLEFKEDNVKTGINYQVGLNKKMRDLGWAPHYNIKEALIAILKEEYGY